MAATSAARHRAYAAYAGRAHHGVRRRRPRRADRCLRRARRPLHPFPSRPRPGRDPTRHHSHARAVRGSPPQLREQLPLRVHGDAQSGPGRHRGPRRVAAVSSRPLVGTGQPEAPTAEPTATPGPHRLVVSVLGSYDVPSLRARREPRARPSQPDLDRRGCADRGALDMLVAFSDPDPASFKMSCSVVARAA